MLFPRLTRLLISGATVAGLSLAAAALPLAAQTEPPAKQALEPGVQIAALTEALQIGPVIEVMREEGIDYGATLEAELFPGRGGARWQAVVGLIYDTGAMQKRFDAAFAAQLGEAPEGLPAMIDFFGSERGQRILELELEARRALMDDAAEEAARMRVEDMIAADDPRMATLRDFAEANDLIELNVMGALNSNLAFFRGMAEGSAFDDPMPEEQMLADVWAQEEDVRQETEDWLFPYLALAYGPLPDEDLQAYVDFSKTPEGKRLNAATFAAFDAVFTTLSHDLGRAAARQMQGEDI
ncbi:MAG: DUF2059 domain-containing protein [Cereibacter changlensis]|uniref:Uncharacterized protein DUF2059 n=2 Tax=Cereibacter changlensis TaxID=402884 RepID=A0A2W7QS77_9RHOB|nr:DUF2059 domain-containing protein [Cereibacter changlensis]PZX50056.1 uncharacterized protein DUF2059 [Cereibacter changlensis]